MLFLQTVGPDALITYNGFQFVPTENKDNINTLIAKFDQHFIEQINETYEQYIFNKRDQEPCETIDFPIIVLHNLAKSCNFCEYLHDSLLCDCIVLGVRCNLTHKRLLQNIAETFQQRVDICHSCEATDKWLKMINPKQQEQITKVQGPGHKKRSKGMDE